MARKLTLDDLTVSSFPVQSTATASVAAVTDVPAECGNTMADPCFSIGPLCSLDCVEASRRTNIAYCCG